MAATILQFPLNRLSRADVDLARRWGVAAAPHGCYLMTSPRTDTGEEHIVAATDTGDEYISVVIGDPRGGAHLFIAPRRGRWVTEDIRAGGGQAIYPTLRDALETIHLTSFSVARRDDVSPATRRPACGGRHVGPSLSVLLGEPPVPCDADTYFLSWTARGGIMEGGGPACDR